MSAASGRPEEYADEDGGYYAIRILSGPLAPPVPPET